MLFFLQPERIQGDQYSVKSDVWSLGISVIEVALGRFPFMEGSSDDEDDDDDDDLPEELRGTLSPTQLEAQVNRRPKEEQDKTNTNGRKPKSSAKGGGGGGGGNSQMSILDLLQHIVNEPAPKLPRHDARFGPDMCDFVDLCLRKDPSARPSPKELTKHEYVKTMESAKVDLLGWVKTLKV